MGAGTASVATIRVDGSGRGGNYTQVMLFGAEDGGAQASVAEPAAGGTDKQNPVVEELRGLDVDAITPRDALYELKKKVMQERLTS